MAWIKSDVDLGDHPKTRKLMRLLDIDVVRAVGHLHILWWWAQKYVADGDLHRFDDAALAEAACWQGEATEFIEAMVTAGFIDRSTAGLAIHDWDDYAGQYQRKRAQNLERQRRFREKKEAQKDEQVHNAPVTRDKRVSNAHVTALDKIREDKSREDKNIHLRGAAESLNDAVKPEKKNGARAPSAPAPAEKTRPVFAALAHRCRYDLGHLTESERGQLNKAASDLVRAGYTVEDLLQMTDHWVGHFGDCSMTPSAIVKHASRLTHPFEPKTPVKGAPYASQGEKTITMQEAIAKGFKF